MLNLLMMAAIKLEKVNDPVPYLLSKIKKIMLSQNIFFFFECVCVLWYLPFLHFEEIVPVCPDKVPRQRLANNITGNVPNGGSGILLAYLFWIHSVFQVPQ